MSTDVIASAVLEYTADSSGVSTAMASATQAVKGFEQAATGAGSKAGTALSNGAKQAGAASSSLTREQERLIASIDRYSVSVGKSRGEVLEYRAAQAGVTTQVQAQIDAIKAQEAALRSSGTQLNKYGISAAQNAAALRNVPAQVTDIIVGLQGGQAPLTVLLQQGGQLKDMFGGIVPAAKALGGALLGLINPYTVVAGLVATLGVAYAQAADQSLQFKTALITTGNFAGTTAAGLQGLTEKIAANIGSQGLAAEALNALASSGKIAGGSLQTAAEAAVYMEKVGGTAIKDTVATFVSLGQEPTKASAKLNEQLHYLNLETYERIRTLEEQGRKEEAAALAQDTYAKSTIARMQQVRTESGYLGQALSYAADRAKEMWFNLSQGVAEVGKAPSVSRLQEELTKAQSGPLAGSPYEQKRIGQLQARIAAENSSLLRQTDKAAAESQRAMDDQAKQQASDRWSALRKSNRTAADIRKEEREQIIADGKRLMKTSKEVDDMLAASEAKHKDPKAPAGTGRADARAGTKYDVQQIEAEAQKLITINSNTERVLEASRAAGLTDESAYYAEKKRLLQASTQLQVDALNAENARLNQDKLNTADSLDRDRKVAENVAKVAKIQADAAANLEVMEIRQASAVRERQAAMLSATQTAKDYLDSVSRGYTRELEAARAGPARSQYLGGVQQIEDRYSGQRRDLDNNKQVLELEGKFNSDAQALYDARLKLINEYQAKALGLWNDHYGQLRALDADWTTGASRALQTYVDDVANVAKLTEQSFTRGFSGMEDALVSFVTTGKLNFKSLIDGMVADVARLTIRQQITGPLAKLLNDSLNFGGAGGWMAAGAQASGAVTAGVSGWGGVAGINLGLLDGARASGGPVAAGGTYLVGERGKELFVPNTAGRIVPNHELGDGGSSSGPPVSVVINNTVGDVATLSMLKQAQANTEARIVSGLRRSRRYNGEAA